MGYEVLINADLVRVSPDDGVAQEPKARADELLPFRERKNAILVVIEMRYFPRVALTLVIELEDVKLELQSVDEYFQLPRVVECLGFCDFSEHLQSVLLAVKIDDVHVASGHHANDLDQWLDKLRVKLSLHGAGSEADKAVDEGQKRLHEPLTCYRSVDCD